MSIEKWLDEQGVSLSFIVRDVRFTIKAGPSEQSTRSIGITLELKRGEDIRLQDERSLGKVAWSMYLVEASEFNENATKLGAIGFISHIDEWRAIGEFTPEECNVSAAVSKELFSSLLEATQNTTLPVTVQVRARGMKYGWEPDGSGKEWDLKATPHPPVIEIGFGIPLVESRLQATGSDGESEDNFPATRADIRSLQNTLVEQYADFKRIGWVVLCALIGVLAATGIDRIVRFIFH